MGGLRIWDRELPRLFLREARRGGEEGEAGWERE